ncbi:hypothetical protein [Methylocystis sp. S23]
MDALDLIATARDLAEANGARKPRQSNLLRAESTAYYALFHTLARCCADLLIGGSNSLRSEPAWTQVYRALDHGYAKQACENNKISTFQIEIQDFANTFVTMQTKRHKADYDPDYKIYKSEVVLDIAITEQAIVKFKTAKMKDKRAFAAYVLLKQRRV